MVCPTAPLLFCDMHAAKTAPPSLTIQTERQPRDALSVRVNLQTHTSCPTHHKPVIVNVHRGATSVGTRSTFEPILDRENTKTSLCKPKCHPVICLRYQMVLTWLQTDSDRWFVLCGVCYRSINRSVAAAVATSMRICKRKSWKTRRRRRSRFHSFVRPFRARSAAVEPDTRSPLHTPPQLQTRAMARTGGASIASGPQIREASRRWRLLPCSPASGTRRRWRSCDHAYRIVICQRYVRS